MYLRAQKLLYPALLITASFLLSACGGGSEATHNDQIENPVTKNESSAIQSSLSQTNTSETVSDVQSSQAIQTSSTAPQTDTASSATNTSVPADATAPKVTQLQLFKLSSNNLTLTWEDAIDNTGISHYELQRNGNPIATVEFPLYSFTDTNLAPGTEYSYSIKAFDLAGNASDTSSVLNVRTVAAAVTANPPANTTNNNPTPSSAGQTSSAASTAARSSLGTSSSRNLASSARSSLAVSSASLSSVRSSAARSSISSAAQSSIRSSSSRNSVASSVSSSSSSSKSSSSKSSSVSSSSASSVARTSITWNHPSQREDGSFLELNEIGGYEIRYRKATDTQYTRVTLNGNRTTEYIYVGDASALEFEIAVFDNIGNYSRFIKVTK